MSRRRDSIACSPADSASDFYSEASVTVRVHSGAKRESGALIPAGLAGSSFRNRKAGTVRNNYASIACSPADSASKSDGETRATIRMRFAAKRESGALIPAGVAGSSFRKARPVRNS
jgi:hypothetical protein